MAQQARDWTGNSASADLCRNDPSRWSAYVCYSDALHADALAEAEADRVAWDWFVVQGRELPGR